MPGQNYLEIIEKKIKITNNLWHTAKKVLAGGVAGNAGLMANRPIYFEKAVGGKLTDVDGNRYIDLLLGGSASILGHSPKEIIDPVKKALDFGTSYMFFHETGIKLSQKLQKHCPHLERIRFANSGTEATMSAIRAARAWTRKEKIAKPEGGYHGQHDYVLMSAVSGKTAGSADRPEAVADCAGIPKFIEENTVIFPWNDIDATVSIVENNADDLAAVIVEPVQGFGLGAIPAEKSYLKALREVTEKHNILLIYDEIVTGFRIGGLGGATGYYGISPDIACYGKSIAGGFPIGVFGGRKDVMEGTISPDALPEQKIFHSGTFTGNAISMTAALACISELEKKDYAYIDRLASNLKSGFEQIAADKGYTVQVTGLGSFFYPHFNSNPIRNLRDKLNDDATTNRNFCLGLIANSVFLTPGHAGATCFAHTDDDIDYILAVAEKVFEQMKKTK
jgi:glutamate-1-semialdehyde 2,1-aminomutase